MWTVCFGAVLKAHGLEDIVGYAYATSGVAAFISPLVVGALADQSIPPTRLVRWLALLAAAFLTLTFTAIERSWGPLPVLALAQLQAICAAPIFGLATGIVFSALADPKREFGPLRSLATLGWMSAGWIVSMVLHADVSTVSGYAAAVTWVLTALFSLSLPEIAPVATPGEKRDVFGLAAISLLRHRDHRIVFIMAALFTIPMAAFYPYTPIHLVERGVSDPTAKMTLGQVSEIISMLGLSWLLARLRLKTIFLLGIFFGVLRYALCALDTTGWLLAGISLHGFSFTLYFVTAQIYLEQRIDPRIRVRAQALLSVMMAGFGNLFGYLGTGWWRRTCTTVHITDWPLFWSGCSATAALVFAIFALSYRGRASRERAVPAPSES
jgi:MFS family permease